MNCKERLETYLRENKVPFQVVHHPLAYTAQEVAAAEHVPGKMLAKVVIAFANGRMVMLGLPAPWRVDPVKAAAGLGVQELRLAHEEEFAAAFSDCEVGAMPPSGTYTICPSMWIRPWPRMTPSSSTLAPTPTPSL